MPMLPKPVSPQTSSIVQSHCSPLLTPLAYFLGRRLVAPFYFGEITVEGQVHLPTQGPVILAPTHRARWDSIVIPLVAGRPATGRDLHFMVTADEVKGIQGWFIRRLGGFPVNVYRPTIASLRHGIDLLQQQAMLVIYPEGGIFRDRRIHRLKPGLARLALQAESAEPHLGVKILPVSLDYDQAFPKRGCNVHVKIGAPLLVANYVNDPGCDALKASAKLLTADLRITLETLAGESQPSTLAPAA